VQPICNSQLLNTLKKHHSQFRGQHSREALRDEEFNNNNNRQVSSIPYIRLETGAKIMEFEQNLRAECLREGLQSREKFIKESRRSVRTLLKQSRHNIPQDDDSWNCPIPHKAQTSKVVSFPGVSASRPKTAAHSSHKI
jgi:hypothetical protein